MYSPVFVRVHWQTGNDTFGGVRLFLIPISREFFTNKPVIFWGCMIVLGLIDSGIWAVRGASLARYTELQACIELAPRLHATCPPGGVSMETLLDAQSNAQWSDVWFWALTVVIVLAVIVWEVWYRDSWAHKPYRLYCAARDLLTLRSETGFDKSYRDLVKQYTDEE